MAFTSVAVAFMLASGVALTRWREQRIVRDTAIVTVVATVTAEGGKYWRRIHYRVRLDDGREYVMAFDQFFPTGARLRVRFWSYPGSDRGNVTSYQLCGNDCEKQQERPRTPPRTP